MKKPALAERLLRIRTEAGYGGDRQRAEFARKLGISPPSLADLESGETKDVGKSLKGYLEIGANPSYILHGRGLPMLFKNIESHLKAQTLVSMMAELDESQQKTVEDVIKALLRTKPGSSPNDPFKTDPPGAHEDQ